MRNAAQKNNIFTVTFKEFRKAPEIRIPEASVSLERLMVEKRPYNGIAFIMARIKPYKNGKNLIEKASQKKERYFNRKYWVGDVADFYFLADFIF